jgi:hypothetical protein
MEHVVALYVRKIFYEEDWLFEGERGFSLGYSCKSHAITVRQDITDSRIME